MKKSLGSLCLLAGSVVPGLLGAGSSPLAQPATSADKGALKVFFVDVEGGQSTLFVTPEGR